MSLETSTKTPLSAVALAKAVSGMTHKEGALFKLLGLAAALPHNHPPDDGGEECLACLACEVAKDMAKLAEMCPPFLVSASREGLFSGAAPLALEEWTLVATKTKDKQSSAEYGLRGRVTTPDGKSLFVMTAPVVESRRPNLILTQSGRVYALGKPEADYEKGFPSCLEVLVTHLLPASV